MVDSTLRILQVNSVEAGGGAEKIAWGLNQAYRRKGHESRLAVGSKLSSDPYVLELDHDPYRKGLPGVLAKAWKPLRKFEPAWPGLHTLHRRTLLAVDHRRIKNRLMGIEDFEFPGTAHLSDLTPARPDVLQLHNLHGDYFDLRELAILSQRVPVVLTLHDAWLLSGHCAHSFDCERWLTGCGVCPDLTIPPPIRRDATAINWQRKREIFSKSRLYIATPSRWLMQKVERSILTPAVIESRVINHGVDLSIFHPADKDNVRETLGIPSDARVILFCANGIRQNAYKDYLTLTSAITLVADHLNNQRILLIILGENAPPERVDLAEVRFIPYQEDARVVASYYQASDVYVHSSRAEAWGLTITEAMACGKPVVATAVGGIPEQITGGETGFLVAAGDAQPMAARIEQVLSDDDLCRLMGRAAADSARRRFDQQRQADDYLKWFESILTQWKQ